MPPCEGTILALPRVRVNTRPLLTETPIRQILWADRVARLGSDVMMLPRAATGRWIIAGSGVSEERSYQRQHALGLTIPPRLVRADWLSSTS
jgi:hypothetical protein